MWPVVLAAFVVLAVLVGVIALLGQPTDASDAGDATASKTEPANEPLATPKPAPTVTVTAEPELTGPAADIRSMLDDLAVGNGTSGVDYDRDLFGQAWFDFDRNGCDTRNDILRRDLRETALKADTNGCKVLTGVLDDWYSGTTVDFVSGGDTSRLVQVDHVVPLSWAWRHGADIWTAELRLEFANDPLNLIATTEHENTSKSDSGPADWLPTADTAQCRYAQRFTAVLDAYALNIDLRNRAMVRGVLDECALSDVFGAFDTAELTATVAGS